jgi:hypothetical protein
MRSRKAWPVVVGATMLLLPLPSSCQTKGLDLYSTALVEAVLDVDKQWARLDRERDYRHILVSKDESVTADYPATVDGLEFRYLTGRELIARRKAEKRDFPVLVIKPATIEGDRIKVIVAWYVVGTKRGMLMLAYEGWSNVSFRFDCEKRAFVFDRVESGGI